MIDEKDVDRFIFNSNAHGLNADFLNMFDFAYKKFGDFRSHDGMKSACYEMSLSKTGIKVDYSQGLPIFSFEF
ncbi:hypothetical protein AB1K83_07780 [Sporosarcina sp. 179-K 3D1 HS]|uniref:hypothetical protein n=1 Tax=Sporosarcina sp. 179-K 3D1 HS TaxID=3232169 RepID=UPI0039A26F79